MSVIQEIVQHKQTELEGFRKTLPPENQVAESHSGLSYSATALLQRLSSTQESFILEIKPHSPAAGVLQNSPDIPAIVESYEKHACAISVLTDQKYFGGSFALLEEVSKLTDVPLLCKDFVIDEIQLDWAVKCGATAVLLIVKGLTDEKLAELHEKAISRGLLPFVEVNDSSEVERALAVNPDVILINNRNLDTLEISLDNMAKIAPLIPQHIVTISASGIAMAEDLFQVSKHTSNFLIGSSLMSAPPEELESKIQSIVN